ncbi:hypothetical protein DERP_000419 [Dermatophagoides pteronyssinus]|uniref:Phosphoserine aminotransferase-like n=1 Tax=Dermatophagoides pteronyssinus TaxID=6956 RepID=A0ABQ8J034_DERPT|nr:hypothetical protein DERP_000419 [Dermatophagoides pteronyssinus]
MFSKYHVAGRKSTNSTKRCSRGEIFDEATSHSESIRGRYLSTKYLISHPFTSQASRRISATVELTVMNEFQFFGAIGTEDKLTLGANGNCLARVAFANVVVSNNIELILRAAQQIRKRV